MSQNSNFPKLSIITITYNACVELNKTLVSIFNQTFTDYEFIIIDGQSNDGTVNLIRENEHKITYWISEKDNGIYDAMNKGLLVAKGEYVQFLNAGDFYTGPTALVDLFSKISATPILIYGDIKIIRTDGTTSTQIAGNFTLENLLKRGTSILCHQAMFVKRTAAPLYNTQYIYKAELNWYFDLVEADSFTYQHIDIPVVYYALGGFGYNNYIKNRLEWLKLVYQRYGLNSILKNRLIFFMLINSAGRYPVLLKISSLITTPVRLLKQSFSKKPIGRRD